MGQICSRSKQPDDVSATSQSTNTSRSKKRRPVVPALRAISRRSLSRTHLRGFGGAGHGGGYHRTAPTDAFLGNMLPMDMLRVIGTPRGNARRASLPVGELLDLVAWFEMFGGDGPIYRLYPHVWRSTMKAYFDSRLDLTGGRTMNFNSESGILWAKDNMNLFRRECHQEFLARVCGQSEQYFDNIYNSKHSQYRAKNGQIISSLSEDVFTFVSVQLHTIQDHCAPRSNVLPEATCVIFVQLRSKQVLYRDTFLHSFECALAAANDFHRMSDECETHVARIKRGLSHHVDRVVANARDDKEDDDDDVLSVLDECVSEVLDLYTKDAVYAARSLHEFVFEPIFEVLHPKLLSREWGDTFGHNDHALSVVKTIDDYVGDLVQYLDATLLPKAMDAVATATVAFYVDCLVTRSFERDVSTAPYWNDGNKVLRQMEQDIANMQDYFLDRTKTTSSKIKVTATAPMEKKIEDEFKLLHVVRALFAIAFGDGLVLKGSPIEETWQLILFVHKRIRDVDTTMRFVGDIWHLASPSSEAKIWEFMRNRSAKWPILRNRVDDYSDKPGILLDFNKMLKTFYNKHPRRIPPKVSFGNSVLKHAKNAFIPKIGVIDPILKATHRKGGRSSPREEVEAVIITSEVYNY